MQLDSPKELIWRIFWHNAFELAFWSGEHYNRTSPTTKICYRWKFHFHMKPYLRICLNLIG
jgi:FPC/CPF motif-containing protein YcgG